MRHEMFISEKTSKVSFDFLRRLFIMRFSFRKKNLFTYEIYLRIDTSFQDL